MRQGVYQRRTTLFQCREIDRFIIGRAILPTPQDDTEPFARECPDGSLMGGAFVALLLVVGTGPAGRPHRCSGPLHEGLSQECGALETPVPPGLVAAAFRHRRHASIPLPLIRRGVAVAWFAKGDEETWGKDGASAGEGVQSREVGMALGAVGQGLGERLDRVQRHAALGHEGLDREGMGGDAAFSGGQRRRALDGVAALGDDLSVAPVMVAEEACQGGASRQWYGLEGRPWGEEVAEDGGIVVVEPLPHRRTGVFQGTGEAIGEAHVVSDQAAAMFDALCEGAHGRTLGLKGLELLAMRAQEFKEEFGVRGVVRGLAGGEGLALPRQHEGIDGTEYDDGALIEFETDGNRLPGEPRAQGAHPRIEGV
jgi:hypothetical protein